MRHWPNKFAMTERAMKMSIIATIVLLIFSLLMWGIELWNERPYARPPARTQVEQVAVDRAVKEVGNYTVVDAAEGIWIKLPKGKRWVVRRKG